ncbi:Thiamin pyrophosphokinase, catalytic domain [Roseivivax jejudonensis]|uniref:Thiamine diphosphokinase n=1 Tax=Roseivivax jejudonensis TaxID=1529041 RepID=A0A1X7A2J2_9RHOB|nr:thiamine diphosphokinase [Roseivivax jejudonensis]SLN68280.1 Thiamin pyrophosphokinase, catalytic domain [Roseivivax jejudonensis]
MSEPILCRDGAVLLVGGGETSGPALRAASARVSGIVAADSGADRLLAESISPDAVIGDMDSISQSALASIPSERLHHIAEQDSTDFDKCLRHIRAPLVLAHGFLGARLDHALAVLSVLARYPDRTCLLAGPSDTVALLPPEVTLDLDPGTRVSLWPLAPVAGRSTGLRWPIEGLAFAPDGAVGTSNAATGPVTLFMDAPRMLVILPAAAAGSLEAGLAARPASWPARAI